MRTRTRTCTDKDARVLHETAIERERERERSRGEESCVIRVGGGEVLFSDVINALARLELSRVEAGVIPANCA